MVCGISSLKRRRQPLDVHIITGSFLTEHLTRIQTKRKDASGVMVTNSSILQPSGNGGDRLAASQKALV